MGDPEGLVVNSISAHYSRFNVTNRLLFTGHSHQAWPNVAEEGHAEAFHDAAELVDEKWTRAFAKADEVRKGFARLLDDDENGEYSLAGSTHDLLIKFISALPLNQRPKLISTTGEFHSLKRQLDRLEESGIEVTRLAPEPIETLSERLAKANDDRTAAVFVSKVMFESSRIVPNLSLIESACQKHGAKFLIDAYHALNVVDVSLQRENLTQVYVVGGGYKYCQLGEGNCFLRYPSDSNLRPLWTGWFADFESLENSGSSGIINYGSHGQRFAGATYDPVSHYRASRVFRFFEEMKLKPAFLREVSQRQIKLLAERFDALDLNPKLIRREKFYLETLGGFLSLVTPQAKHFCEVLRKHGVLTDYRGEYLRFGPAPYLSDEQLINAIEVLGDVANS